jgi:hypothetical protein
VLVAQVRGHEPGVHGEDGATVVAMFGHILTGNPSRGKAGQGELKAEDRSAFWKGSSRGGVHTGLVRVAAGGTSGDFVMAGVVFWDGF